MIVYTHCNSLVNFFTRTLQIILRKMKSILKMVVALTLFLSFAGLQARIFPGNLYSSHLPSYHVCAAKIIFFLSYWEV